MRLTSLFCFLLLLLSSSLVVAQAPILSLSGFVGQSQGTDSTNLNGFETVTMVLKSDSAFFTGDVTLTYQINNDSSRILVFDTIQNVTLNPGDTTNYTTQFQATSAHFTGGVNIMVVWPSAQNAITGDSLRDSVLIIDEQNSLPEEALKPLLRIFPNPAREQLHLSTTHAQDKIAQVEILDLTGKMLKIVSSEVETVSLNGLASGIYFVRVRFRDEKVICRKFIVE